MKLEEINQRYEVSLDKLRKFEDAGFFHDAMTCGGCVEYHEEEIEALSCILSLDKLGMDMHTIQHYLCLKHQGDCTKNERKKILLKQREIILNDLHDKQKCIDCLDYLIYELE